MNKENVLYVHSDMLSSYYEEWNSAIGSKMDSPWGYQQAWNKPEPWGQIVHDPPYMSELKFKKQQPVSNRKEANIHVCMTATTVL